MTVTDLDTAASVHSFKNSTPNALICFSATWCGPCKAAKPAFMDMAAKYESDPSISVKFGIVYEHTLGQDIHEFNIRAFPTYVLYTNNGSTEFDKVQGANLDGIRDMITRAGCKMDFGEGNTLGGSGEVKTLSAAEARAQRLAMFEKKSTPTPTEKTDDGDAKMNDVEEEKKPSETVPVPTTAAAPQDDVEMKDASKGGEKVEEETTKDAKSAMEEDATADAVCPEVEMIDPTESLNKEDLTTLTESMGFTLIRAQKGLLNSSSGVEGAVEWLMNHQDDGDIDEPIAKVPKAPAGGGTTAQSYKCNECGKILSNMANLELHANKTGHSDFEESTQAAKVLTEEEKIAKVAELKALLKAKRMEREEAEKVDDVTREKQRRSMGQQMAKTREEMDRQARMREAKLRKKEKEDFKRERARIKAEIAKDKLERKAHHGKLTSKLGVDGYNPDAIQYDVDAETPQHHPHKKIKASVAKIDEYITKVSSYRAGGDGGKCLKILLTFIKNVVDKPDEDKFKRINMESKAYKTKVKPFVGAKALLLAVGFSPAEGGEPTMILTEDADRDVLAQTKEKLEKAFAAY